MKGVALALLRRPTLWAIAVTQLFVVSPAGWWRRWPPLPWPDREYFRWRLQTQYGDPDHDPVPADVVAYLHWCKEERRALR